MMGISNLFNLFYVNNSITYKYGLPACYILKSKNANAFDSMQNQMYANIPGFMQYPQGFGVLQSDENQETLYERMLIKNEKTIPPIDYPFDILEKSGSSDNKVLFTASDGRQYDLVKILESRIFNAANITRFKDITKYSTLINLIKKKLNIEQTTDKIGKMAREGIEILENPENIEETFYVLTGKEYTEENVEKLLKSELKLNIEKTVARYIGKEFQIPVSQPYISQNYLSFKNNDELKNSRKVLNDDEKELYEKLKTYLSQEYVIKLQNALDNGQLLQNNSDDSSTVLDNLYKIATTKRVENLNSVQILEECLDILDNPYIITQLGENIPKEYQSQYNEILENNSKELRGPMTFNFKISSDEEEMEIDEAEEIEESYTRHINTCTASSLEFYMAVQNTAEFFRMVEGLTSDKKSVKKNINLYEDLERLLNVTNLPYENNNGIATVTVRSDDNAYFLAEIQSKYKDEGERSMVDILMQSAIMNLGSGQTYESVSDIRERSEICSDNVGLSSKETALAKEILTGQVSDNKTYKAYYLGKISSQFKQENVKNEILDLLLKKGSIVAGIVFTYEGRVCCAHEITIIGYTQNLNGYNLFIVQDSDDINANPVAVLESELLPQIDHILL